MKNFIRWKILILTCAVCLLPIVLGIVLWDKLPDTIAIHFNLHNQPDSFSSKPFAVFGLPVLMVLLQTICCILCDVNAKKYGPRKKFETAVKWIIPIMTLLLQGITFAYSLGSTTEIRKPAMVIVAGIFLVIGNYLPKFDYIKNNEVDVEKARNINRFIGFESVILGILAIISIFLPPIASIIWLFLLIPYAVISILYSAVVIKKH